MVNRLSFSLILMMALCACSKKDGSAGNNVQSPPVSATDPSKDTSATANKADPGSKTELASKTDPASGNSDDDKGTSKEAAIPTEEKDKKQTKQTQDAAQGSVKKSTRSVRGRWDQFQKMVDLCDARTGSAREECWANARDTFRAANFKCEALGPERRTKCLQFAERWNNPVADAPSAPVKRSEEPAVTATDPGDPRPAERNRDSTKQH